MPNRRPKAATPAGAANPLCILILAAGKGTRLNSARPKVLHEVAGRPLVAHVIAAAARVLPAEHIYVVIGHEAEQVRRAVADTGVGFILQAEQRGTGHAVMAAANVLARYQQVLVLSGDVPLLRAETIAQLRDFHARKKADMTILTAEPADAGAYGRIQRKSSRSDDAQAIIESKALTTKQRATLKEINSGTYVFHVAPLLKHLAKLGTDNAHREYYLTDMADILRRARARVVALRAASDSEVLGANTLAELAQLDAMLRRQKCDALMAAGVSLQRPDTCVIDAEVTIAPDTILEPFVQLLGKTRIGAHCRIRSFSVITDSELGDHVQVRPGCVLDRARVGHRALLGPYAHLRPGSDIGDDAHVGNFVETKATRLGKGSKANHLSYLGDADIGDGVNVGAGTITCNYDGTQKHKTVVEDGAFIGSDSTLVAPVTVGRNAYVAAGSTITDDVPADALALGRSRQTVKDGWARERRKAASKK